MLFALDFYRRILRRFSIGFDIVGQLFNGIFTQLNAFAFAFGRNPHIHKAAFSRSQCRNAANNFATLHQRLFVLLILIFGTSSPRALAAFFAEIQWNVFGHKRI